jgi:hypothetical protein
VVLEKMVVVQIEPLEAMVVMVSLTVGIDVGIKVDC